jgi:predicted metal-dependent phosphoesterase TrpH
MIAAEAKQKGLAGIAVTDHNSGAWTDLIKGAAPDANLVVFPGVEITCMGGPREYTSSPCLTLVVAGSISRRSSGL